MDDFSAALDALLETVYDHGYACGLYVDADSEPVSELREVQYEFVIALYEKEVSRRAELLSALRAYNDSRHTEVWTKKQVEQHIRLTNALMAFLEGQWQ